MNQALKRMVCNKRISYRVLRRQTGTDIGVRGFLFIPSPPMPRHRYVVQHTYTHISSTLTVLNSRFPVFSRQVYSSCDHSDVFLSSMSHFPVCLLFYLCYICSFFFTCISYKLFPLCFKYQHTYTHTPSLHVHWYIQVCVNRYSWKTETVWREEQSASAICKCKYPCLGYAVNT